MPDIITPAINILSSRKNVIIVQMKPVMIQVLSVIETDGLNKCLSESNGFSMVNLPAITCRLYSKKVAKKTKSSNGVIVSGMLKNHCVSSTILTAQAAIKTFRNTMNRKKFFKVFKLLIQQDGECGKSDKKSSKAKEQ